MKTLASLVIFFTLHTCTIPYPVPPAPKANVFLAVRTQSGNLPAGAAAQRETIDRIVAIVGNYFITLSDIRTEKLMREVLGEPAPKNDREVLDELIDQNLIRAALDHHSLAEPSEAELDEAMSQIKDVKGLPPESVRAAVRDHLRVQHFVIVYRVSPGRQSEQAVDRWRRKHVE